MKRFLILLPLFFLLSCNENSKEGAVYAFLTAASEGNIDKAMSLFTSSKTNTVDEVRGLVASKNTMKLVSSIATIRTGNQQTQTPNLYTTSFTFDFCTVYVENKWKVCVFTNVWEKRTK